MDTYDTLDWIPRDSQYEYKTCLRARRCNSVEQVVVVPKNLDFIAVDERVMRARQCFALGIPCSRVVIVLDKHEED